MFGGFQLSGFEFLGWFGDSEWWSRGRMGSGVGAVGWWDVCGWNGVGWVRGKRLKRDRARLMLKASW